VKFILHYIIVYNGIYRSLFVETNQAIKLVVRKSRNNIIFYYPQESGMVAALPRNPSYIYESECLLDKL
jgi:hypothetical protein